MNTWADLHGEDGDVIPHKPSKGAKWCDNCQCWVESFDAKRWTGDDRLHWLCPGCDVDLVEPEIME